jgi:hypothetical protein
VAVQVALQRASDSDAITPQRTQSLGSLDQGGWRVALSAASNPQDSQCRAWQKDLESVECPDSDRQRPRRNVSQKTFAEIRAGKEITLQGDGFALEEGIVADYWEFNSDGLGSVKLRRRKTIVSR